MIGTGIIVEDEIIAEFSALRMKRAHRYIIMRVNEDKTKIVAEKIGARDSTFDDFKESMPKDECRYFL